MVKQMTKAERAAYQRDYRARKKREAATAGEIASPRAQVDTSTSSTPVSTSSSTDPSAEPRKPKPAFLAAPDDDCATCGHDRQTTHPGGGKCGYGCICRRFRPAGTELVECALCGHDEYHGHAASPCDHWLDPGYCGCPAFVDPSEPF